MNHISHRPWIPSDSGWNLDGKRIAIVGYSHYFKAGDEDSDEMTRDVIRDVIHGENNLAFFNKLLFYFGYDNHPEFWNNVMFFNFIPQTIGANRDKFLTADRELTARARIRAEQIIRSSCLDKVFVFTTKGWRDFPETNEENRGESCTPLNDGSKETWGTYTFARKTTLACGFRHPLYAKGTDMKEAIRKFRKL